jgi:hypothetical protein
VVTYDPAAAVSSPGPGAPSTTLADDADDLLDLITSATEAGPGYVDILSLTVGNDETNLVYRYDLTGDIPAALDPLKTTVGYTCSWTRRVTVRITTRPH